MIDFDKLLSGDRRTLGKAITLIESTLAADKKLSQDLLQKVLPHSGKSFRLGITGVPGVGKSTLIETLGIELINKGFKVAVLAIDPSSPISGGSILGDKTRMEKLSQDNNAFIRPSPSSGFLGGIAQKTRETILLCEAAGYDFIIIETVGVGQSEYEVSKMVDFFMLLMLPNSGDEIQGIKKGILELADLIIINKADGSALHQAEISKNQMQSALEYFQHSEHWKTQIMLSSSLNSKSTATIIEHFENFKKLLNENIPTRRKEQNIFWFKSLINELIQNKINNDTKLIESQKRLISEIMNYKTTPLMAAAKLLNEIF